MQVDPKSQQALAAQIDKFIAETNRDTRKVIKDQARLLARDMLKITPPHGRQAFSESLAEQRRIGMQAVEKDIRTVFQPISKLIDNVADKSPNLAYELMMASGIHSTSRISKKANQRVARLDMVALEAIFRNAFPDLTIIKEVVPSLHTAQRNRRGRINERHAKKYIVADERSLTRYIKNMRNHVGKAKAGWLRAALDLGIKAIPKWIRKHATPGLFRDGTTHATDPKPFITIGNMVQYGTEFPKRLFLAAMQNRIRGMKKQLEKMAEHKARKVAAAQAGKAASGSAV